MINAINGFAMTDDYDFYIEVGDDGYFDIVPECNHEMVSNLIRSRLYVEVGWNEIMRSPDVSDGVKMQLVRGVVLATYGVDSVDMSGFQITINANNDIDFGVICPVIDCANSKMCITL